jgi:hypothetical protein
MKNRINFKRDDLDLVGDLYVPDDVDENARYEALIVQGSLTSVKEQMPATYARKLADLAFVALAFDYSHYGESGGWPRQLESPAEKLSDLQAAVTYLDGQRYVGGVGMLGVCTSGGNAAYLAAADPRVKAIATVAGMFPDQDVFTATYGEDGVATRRELAAEARKKFEETGEGTSILTYSDSDESAANYNSFKGAYDYYENENRGNVPQFKNALDVASWDGWLSFNPIAQAPAITIPTMVVHSAHSAYPEQAKKFYEAVQGEKELVWADGNHFCGPQFG